MVGSGKLIENTQPAVLSVRNLTITFGDGPYPVVAAHAVSFVVARGRIVALVGESGSGKTATAFSIARLLRPPGRIQGGTILFQDEDLLAASDARMRGLRGDRLAMVFQNPMNSLNPSMQVARQIMEEIAAHRALSRAACRRRAVELLASVRIPEPERVAHLYPHELSGGMRQRVMIAMAVALEPDLLIADEPTTALDVTIQSQIVDLLVDLHRQTEKGILFITHDLALASSFCDDVVVMYAGQVVEMGAADVVLAQPLHPYTAGLIEAIPRTYWQEQRVSGIPGQAVSGHRRFSHCQFANRCPHTMPRCREQAPELRETEPGRQVRCFLYDGGGRPDASGA